MTELELYKFITENNIEWHPANNDGVEDIIMFVNLYHMQAFSQILGPNIVDEDGVYCILKQGYLCFWMNDICDYFDIKVDNVFKKITS